MLRPYKHVPQTVTPFGVFYRISWFNVSLLQRAEAVGPVVADRREPGRRQARI